jgi:hypothetical protein
MSHVITHHALPTNVIFGAIFDIYLAKTSGHEPSQGSSSKSESPGGFYLLLA